MTPTALQSTPVSAVVLLSGGLDSTTLLHFASRQLGIRRVYSLSFDYGQKHWRELEMAAWQAKAAGVMEHRVVDVGVLGELTEGGSALTDAKISIPDLDALDESVRGQPPTYVPNRNMVFLGLAAAYAESQGVKDVFYGAQAQDEYGYWDCTEEFIENLNAVFGLNRKEPVTVHAPFVAMKKAEILKLGLELGVEFARTWTCYRGESRPCGTCPTCMERGAAFREAGVSDPLDAGVIEKE